MAELERCHFAQRVDASPRLGLVIGIGLALLPALDMIAFKSCGEVLKELAEALGAG
jgi:hypothetical protein